MKITRRFTTAIAPVVNQIEWKKVDVDIAGTAARFTGVEVPDQWSDDAARILASKYFRRMGVPSEVQIRTDDISGNFQTPIWLTPQQARPDTKFDGETSARQVFHRLAGHWTYTGWKNGYFDAEIDAEIFYDELVWMLANQFAAPNSPQWFNTGLWWAYGIEGENAGLWVFDNDGRVSQIANSYERPQVHACFINSIDDNLVDEGGIFDLLTREARIFKFGSGAGANFSNLRGKGEPLSGGGRSSGLMSFLEIFDRAAGAIQSGGTTRRAAKMVVLDADHPEIEDFINWKVREEAKAASMVVGSQLLRNYYLNIGDAKRDPFIAVPVLTIDRLNAGFEPDHYDASWEGEAMRTVGGQNSNNSVRFPDAFFAAVGQGEAWHLRNRTDGAITKTVRAADLWTSVCRAAWACADPGVQFHDTINAWHTCAADGEIKASNPCCFTGDTHVVTKNGDIQFTKLLEMQEDGELPDVLTWSTKEQRIVTRRIIKVWIAGIATKLCHVHTPQGSFRCTPEHLWLMQDSDPIQANLLSVGSRLQSARDKGSRFIEVSRVDNFVLEEGVLVYDMEVEETHNFGIRDPRNHRGGEVLPIFVHNSEYMFLDDTACNLASLNLARFLQPDGRFDFDAFMFAVRLWTIVLDISISMASFPSREIAEGTWKYRTLGLGYANAGGLLMRLGIPYDSDEGRTLIATLTAIMHGVAYNTSNELAEHIGTFPRFDSNAESMWKVIRKHREAAMGLPHGNPQQPNLEWLYGESRARYRNAQVTLIAPTGTISFVMDCPDFTGIEPAFALSVHKNLAGGGHLTLTNSAVREGLTRLGYALHTINLIEAHIAAHGTIRGCLDIKPEHVAVFETSNEIRPLAHVEMVAAVQPFLSGAVSKTVNLPNSATIADIDEVYRAAHRLGLKSVALYRDGSKLTQPLSQATADNTMPSDSAAETEIHHFDRAGKKTIHKVVPTISTNEPARGAREALLPRRKGYTHKLKIGDQTLYLRTGEYEDGRLGEIFLSMSKEGGTTRAIMEGFAKSISIGLQYGVPLAELVDAFIHVKFEPAGFVQGHDRIKTCQSVFDLVFRELGLTYLGREELANLPAAPGDEPVLVVTGGGGAHAPSVSGIPSGFLCGHCGAEMRRTGSCLTCPDCFANTGCG